MTDSPAQDRKLGLARIERGGRFYTKYDPSIALDIVERVAEGELLSKICAKDAVPLTVTKQTFLRWVASVPELQTAYSAAIQISAHSFEEKAIDRAQRVADAPGSPQNVSAASLLISQYRWSAARRNPTRYSDKGNTQIVVPINITSSLDLGTGEQTSNVEVPDIYTISLPVVEGEFSEVTDEPGNVETPRPEARAVEEQKKEITKEDFKGILRPDIPVVGSSRQPILEASKKRPGSPPGPRKRVLTPRTSK